MEMKFILKKKISGTMLKDDDVINQKKLFREVCTS